jgi:general secretion pathway protein N
MKGLAYALVALLALAAALFAFAPATLVDARLAAATSGALRLSDSEGSLWRGGGTLTDARGSVAVPLRWRLEPWPLLRREVSLHLTGDRADGAPVAGVTLRAAEWRVEGFLATLPAALLPALVQANAPATLGGEIRIDVPQLAVTSAVYAGNGTLRWRDATLSLGAMPPLPLGTIEIALAPRGNAIAGTVSNRGGAVRVSGEVSAGPAETMLDLALFPDAGAPPASAAALKAFGRPDGAGTRITWRGAPLLRLPPG